MTPPATHFPERTEPDHPIFCLCDECINPPPKAKEPPRTPEQKRLAWLAGES